VFTRRPALTRRPFGGIVCQNLPPASRLPDFSAAPFFPSVFSVRPLLGGPSSAVSSDLSAKSLSALPHEVQMRFGHPGWGDGTFRRSDVQTIRPGYLSSFLSCICKLFSPVAELKLFLFNEIRTLFAKHRGWVSDRVTDVLTFRRSDVQTLHVSPLHSVLTHFSPSKSFRIRSYPKTLGVCPQPQTKVSRLNNFQTRFPHSAADVLTFRRFDVRTIRSPKVCRVAF
jgi:hypothetical protein